MQKPKRNSFLESVEVTSDKLSSFVRFYLQTSRPEISDILLLGNDEYASAIYATLKPIFPKCLLLDSQDVAADRIITEKEFVIYCQCALTDTEWIRLNELTTRYGNKIQLVWQLCRNSIILSKSMMMLDYLEGLEAIERTYIMPPDQVFRAHKIVNYSKMYPVEGKSVIEFGPMDGCHTGALVRMGVREITSIEIRPENYIKTALAKELYGWKNVDLVFDNFHTVTKERYGRFDICLASGVYYHSDAPFVFLENIVGLSDVIFFSGYCATDKLPADKWIDLEYKGKIYKAKLWDDAYRSFTGGVGVNSYYFSPESIMQWFEVHGYILSQTEVLPMDKYAGAFIWFCAGKK